MEKTHSAIINHCYWPGKEDDIHKWVSWYFHNVEVEYTFRSESRARECHVYLCVYFLKIVKVKVCSNMWNRKGDSRQNKSSLSLSVGLGAGLGGRQTEQTKWFFFHTAL